MPLDLRPKKTRAIRRRLTKHQRSLKHYKKLSQIFCYVTKTCTCNRATYLLRNFSRPKDLRRRAICDAQRPS
ncbi:60S ribosomal protein L35 [Linum grandiflorum]